MWLPEEVNSVIFGNKFVEQIFFASHLLKRRVSSSHDEKDDANSKQIYSLSLIFFLFNHFWCHVSWCALVCLLPSTSIFTLKFWSKSEVNNFDDVFVCNLVKWIHVVQTWLKVVQVTLSFLCCTELFKQHLFFIRQSDIPALCLVILTKGKLS